MRTTGLLVLVLGLALLAGGLVLGFGQYASWNGRNTIAVVPLEVGTLGDARFVGRHARRYWVAVQAQVERGTDASPARVAFKMPLVLALRDEDGNDVLKHAGWFDPSEASTSLYGNVEGMPGRGPVIAERLLGPFPVKASQPFRGLVEVGLDQIGSAHLSSLRLVVYDDELPAALRAPFAVAGVGGFACLVALGMLVFALIRRISRGGPRTGRKRS